MTTDHDEKTAGISSFRSLNSCSSWHPLESCYPVSIKKANMIHKVTLSSPSPVLSFVERAPQETETSHITAVESEHRYPKSENESTSKTIRDVHVVRILDCMSKPPTYCTCKFYILHHYKTLLVHYC